MKQTTAQKNLSVIQAFAEGKKVQFKGMGDWIDVDEPNFNDHDEYRVKPEPVTHESWQTLYRTTHGEKKIVTVGGTYSEYTLAKKWATSGCDHILHIKYVDGVPSAEFIPFTE